MQKFVSVLDCNMNVKNAPKPSSKYLDHKMCKIKQTENISVALKIFLNQLKFF